MGVIGLNGAIKRLLYKKKFHKKAYPTDVSTLALDFNAILHPIAQYVYSYGDNVSPDRTKEYVKSKSSSELFEEFINTLISRINAIIQSVNPTDMLILAVDGPVNQGKIAQQRSRRYTNASFEDESVPTFDSNALTPGTEFMTLIDKRIEKWLSENINSKNSVLPSTVIYSSHLVQGEGEHKILDIYRNKDIFVDVSGNRFKGYHVIFGNDADLMLLTAICPVQKIINAKIIQYKPGEDYLKTLKERSSRGDRKSQNVLKIYENSKNKTLTKTEFVDIDSMKSHLKTLFSDKKFNNDAVHDFVAMVSLLGNDFLPGLTALYDKNLALETMKQVYNKLRKPLTYYDRDEKVRKYDWRNLSSFIEILSKSETLLLNEIYNRCESYYNYPSKILKESVEISNETTTVNFETYRSRHYQNALLNKKRKTDVKVSRRMVSEMCLHYIATLSWVYRYYQLGTKHVDTEWVYKYFQSPLIMDMAKSLRYVTKDTFSNFDRNEESPKITPLVQLLCVLPTTSVALLPEGSRTLMTPNSPIYYMYPSQFIYELDGVKQHYEGHAIIPFANISDVEAAVTSLMMVENGNELTSYIEEIPLKNIYVRQEDVQRNIREQEVINDTIQEELQRKRGKKYYKKKRKEKKGLESNIITNNCSWSNKLLL